MVAYLGVMSVQDGVDRVVWTAHHLRKLRNAQDVLFALIGRGDCWNQLQELAGSLGLNGTVQFTGRISDEALLQYLSTADVCIAPGPAHSSKPHVHYEQDHGIHGMREADCFLRPH